MAIKKGMRKRRREKYFEELRKDKVSWVHHCIMHSHNAYKMGHMKAADAMCFTAAYTARQIVTLARKAYPHNEVFKDGHKKN